MKIVKKIFRYLSKKLGINKFIKYFLYKQVYPKTYEHYCKKAVNPKKVVFIEVRFTGIQDNFRLIYDRFIEKGYDVSISYLKNIELPQKLYIERCLSMIKEIADAKYVFLSDASDVFSCIPLRGETIVTQTWHACGAFKKFGMSTVEKIFGQNRATLEKYPNYRNLTHVTVSSPEVVWAFEEAMDIKSDSGIVKPTGISRTDVFFDQVYREKARKKLHDVFPESDCKKIILYAPTFRGRVKTATSPDELDLSLFKKQFQKDYVMVVKHHPFVKNPPDIAPELRDFVKDISADMEINELLCVADVCISDYSSLVFEYSLFEKPMIFFAFDIKDYDDWRGFYYNYDELTPGPVYTTNEEILNYIKNIDMLFDKQKVIDFKEKFMKCCDGHATDRIMDLLLND